METIPFVHVDRSIVCNIFVALIGSARMPKRVRKTAVATLAEAGVEAGEVAFGTRAGRWASGRTSWRTMTARGRRQSRDGSTRGAERRAFGGGPL